jgi:ubiquinone biosynthesis protein UbiJ
MTLALIESVLNRVLEMDGNCLAELAALEGKAVAIELRGTGFAFLAMPGVRGLHLQSRHGSPAHVTVRAAPLDLFAYLFAAEPLSGSRGMEISGDVEVARQLQAIFRKLDPDWEEELSRWLGDFPARRIGNLLRGVRRGAGTARNSIARGISEYLRFESELLPHRREVGAFVAGIDVLRDDAERLKARIARLGRRLRSGA